ncbi:hypothetical protein ARHIZOSPH14_27570 [Agromyces rhizosphaerae]|uniref:Uncharacterized protein n=1 Tax=Agromyces rhizosphaerae TaxID=88374 RepID=A0A9W6FQG6_9MICO|nr:hypothetical protein [Agromyces rhizosphaerae]GLI28515.1 hypothetical protein ARHIZOSPH14_27570 [Agromyces rhizosphaerae]
MLATQRLPRIVAIMLAALLAIVFAIALTGAKGGNGHGGPGGNSAVAKLCNQGSWEELAPSADPLTPFESEEACVAYGAQGGSIVAVTDARLLVHAEGASGTAPTSECDIRLELSEPDPAWSDVAVSVTFETSTGAVQVATVLDAGNAWSTLLVGEVTGFTLQEVITGATATANTGAEIPVEFGYTSCQPA